MSFVLPVLLVVANVMGAGMIVPQVVHLHRTRLVDGVSAVWVGVGIAMNLWWLAYATAGGLVGLVPVSLLGFGLYSVIAIQLTSIEGHRSVPAMVGGAIASGLGPAVALVAGGWAAAGLAIGLTYGAQFAPAAVAAVRSTSTAGISATTWSMAWIEAGIWLYYGLAIDDIALAVGGLGGTAMASVILLSLADQPRLAVRRG